MEKGVRWEPSRGVLGGDRDSIAGKDTIFCRVLDLELLHFLLPEPNITEIKKSFRLNEINFNGGGVKVFELADGDYKNRLVGQYGKKRASLAIDQSGQIYFYSLADSRYILDSRLRDKEDVNTIFSVLEEK